MIYLLFYVDDMLIFVELKIEVMKVKVQLNEKFDMKDLGAAKKTLGIEILRDRKADILHLNQKGYIEKVLYKFNMLNAKAISTLWLTTLNYHLLCAHGQMKTLITYYMFLIRVQLDRLCMLCLE